MAKCIRCASPVAENAAYCSSCGRSTGSEDQLVTIDSTDQHLPSLKPSPSAIPGGLSFSLSASDHGGFVSGTILANRFRIVSLIGRGGMGEVYRADDLELGHYREIAPIYPSVLQFRYRQSPRPLQSTLHRRSRPLDPAPFYSGEISLLDTKGRLVSFSEIPPEKSDPPSGNPAPDWDPFWQAASLSPERLTPTSAVWTQLASR
jgi:serine/threonine protein kinase